jgi:hypothetical protein
MMRRRRASIAVFASLLALALIASAARGATQVRQVHVEVPAHSTTPPTPPGTLTLDFVFKNKRASKHKFTPRQLTRIDFSKVPLFCHNTPGQGTSTLLFTRTLQTAVKVKKLPPPAGNKPKPGRYAFNFVYSFQDFTGRISGVIDKRNGMGKPRSQGKLLIEDLDADPAHTNCTSNGLKSWGGLPLTPA